MKLEVLNMAASIHSHNCKYSTSDKTGQNCKLCRKHVNQKNMNLITKKSNQAVWALATSAEDGMISTLYTAITIKFLLNEEKKC